MFQTRLVKVKIVFYNLIIKKFPGKISMKQTPDGFLETHEWIDIGEMCLYMADS